LALGHAIKATVRGGTRTTIAAEPQTASVVNGWKRPEEGGLILKTRPVLLLVRLKAMCWPSGCVR